MRKYRDALFDPQTLVLWAGEDRRDRLEEVTERVRATGFARPILDAQADTAPFPAGSLAVLCAPPGDLEAVAGDLATRGADAALLLYRQSALAPLDHRPPLRVIGPGAAGLCLPRLRLALGFDGASLEEGGLAVLAHSASFMRAVTAWGAARRIGFSIVAGLGAAQDLDMAELLDDLAGHAPTRAVILQISQVRDLPRFATAGRVIGRSKPVVVLSTAGDPGAEALFGDGAVLEALFHRLGFLTVEDMPGLFAAATALARARGVRKGPIRLYSNSDALARVAHASARRSARAYQIDLALSGEDGGQSVTGLGANRGGEGLEEVLTASLSDADTAATLVVLAPEDGAEASSDAQAQAAVNAHAATRVARWPAPVLAVATPGNEAMRATLDAAGILAYETPTEAVDGLAQLRAFETARTALMETPPTIAQADIPDPARIERLLDNAGPVLSPEAEDQILTAVGLAPARPGDGGAAPRALALTVRTDTIYGAAIALVPLGPFGRLAAAHPVLALPPLSLVLAEQAARRALTAVDAAVDDTRIRELAILLVRLSWLIVRHPRIAGLHADAVIWDGAFWRLKGTRMTLGRNDTSRPRTGIRPYPVELEQWITLSDGTHAFLRPVRADDEPALGAFFKSIDREDFRLRFFTQALDVSHAFLARLTQLDYARDMAFAAYDKPDGTLIGVVRLAEDPDGVAGEYAVLVRSDLKGAGLGWALMQRIIAHGRQRGLATIWGDVLAENRTMLAMCRKLGFHAKADPNDPSVVRVTLDLTRPIPAEGGDR